MQGFDVPDFGTVYAFSLITPMKLHEFLGMLKEVQISANEAIKHYNNENVIVLTCCPFCVFLSVFLLSCEKEYVHSSSIKCFFYLV